MQDIFQGNWPGLFKGLMSQRAERSNLNDLGWER